MSGTVQYFIFLSWFSFHSNSVSQVLFPHFPGSKSEALRHTVAVWFWVQVADL